MEQGIVLGSDGHYFNSGNGACQAAKVVAAFSAAGPVNVVAWSQDGIQTTHTSVSVNHHPATEDTTSSFHLGDECPWAR